MAPSTKDFCPPESVVAPDETIAWRTRKLHACEEIVPAIEDIAARLEAAGYSDKELFAIRLALEEALVNAIKHGHKGDTRKEVQIRYHLSPERFLVEIQDQGAGFRPEDVPDPFAPENLERSSGRGLLLIRSYATWVRYNDAGNCVTMCWQHHSA
jgi:serine/threonine-protein kinase RsbW